MRFVTWNLNHRLRAIGLLPVIPAAIRELRPDLLVLTEYFPRGDDRLRFIEQLTDAGLPHQALSVTPHAGKFNHVLVAANEPLQWHSLELTPDLPSDVPANAVRVRLTRACIDVLGIRVPDWNRLRRPRRTATWDFIERTIETLDPQRSVVIGDFNTDPSDSAARQGNRFASIAARGWTVAALPSGASYWSHKGGARRIDHAFVTPGLRIARAEYVTSVGAYRLAGSPGALSDHAALVVDLVLCP